MPMWLLLWIAVVYCFCGHGYVVQAAIALTSQLNENCLLQDHKPFNFKLFKHFYFSSKKEVTV
jgi:hypothetical protein